MVNSDYSCQQAQADENNKHRKWTVELHNVKINKLEIKRVFNE